ncbi:MAG TPA: hypothetical protein VGB54_14135 [Allosphingosinicella sp.]|jgi:uncharacterized membrane protein
MNARDDNQLDELLWRGLKLDYRAPDSGFVARVDRAILERERYRRLKSAMSRRLVSDLVGLAAVLASVVVLSFAPGLRDALANMELWPWAGLLSLLVLWLATRRPAGDLP